MSSEKLTPQELAFIRKQYAGQNVDQYEIGAEQQFQKDILLGLADSWARYLALDGEQREEALKYFEIMVRGESAGLTEEERIEKRGLRSES